MKKSEEILYWQQEFPDLDEQEILDILEVMMEFPFEEEPEPGLEDRKQRITDIEDYTKYW